ncbi:MAG: radical SAM protein [Acidobacteriota bacterium]
MGIRYAEPVFRPPSEADSLILQVTLGCSHNTCVFCAMYRTKKYAVRPLEEVASEIEYAAERLPEIPRVFLADGDALAAPTPFLLDVIALLRRHLPKLRRISLYATPQNLLEKSPSELVALREAGLQLFYLGLESGSARVLKAQAKGVTPEQAVEAVRRGHEAGLRSSIMVLLGLGGVEGSEDHAVATAEACNAIQPAYLSALTWMPVRQAPLWRLLERGTFQLPDDDGILAELHLLVQKLDLKDTVFRANHASNPLPIGGRLSRDREELLATIAAARRGSVPLRPYFMRGT